MPASHLKLGWRVTSSGAPRFWLNPEAKPGKQSNDDLVRVVASAMMTHTVIIAQSGSGKSFFLGRLIEELMLRTKAKCIVLDPNGDFRMVQEVQDKELWTSARFDPVLGIGKLPDEATREEFEDLWSRVSTNVLTGDPLQGPSPHYERLQLWWPTLSSEFLTEETGARLRSELYHCHRFVRVIGQLCSFRYQDAATPVNLLDIAETLHRRYREVDGGSEFAERALREALRQEFNLPAMVKARLDRLEEQGKLKPKVRPARDQRLRASLGRWFDQAVAALEYVTKSTAKHYFAKAREYEAAGIIRREPPSRRDSHPSRLQVVDLPSLRERSTKLLAINALVETEWENVRVAWESALEEDPADDERVPTFIVVDEAHNLIPKEVRGKSEQALREQFRTIIAEGRKYGLFLVLVSQRPDKLDPLVISECENRALMRMNSRTLLGTCRELLSLEDVATPLLDKCLEFGPGRVLLVGPWAQEGQQFLYCAARRTVEGGRNLREDFWAAPP